MAASVVQIGQRVSGAGVSTHTITLPALPTAGNAVVVGIAVWLGSEVNLDEGDLTDNHGNTYTLLAESPVANGARAYCFAAFGVTLAPGVTTFAITIDPAMVGFYINAQAVEVAGLAATPLDQTATAQSVVGGSDNPIVGPTATTTQADEIVFAVLQVSEDDQDVGIDVPATPGYTNLGVDQNSSATIAFSFDYKVVSETGAQSAAWGTLDGGSAWSAVLVTLKAAAGGGSDTILTPAAGLLSMSGRAALADLGLGPGRGLLNVSGKLPSTDLSMSVSMTGLVLSGKSPAVASDTGLSVANGTLVIGTKTVFFSQTLLVAKGLMNFVGRSVTIVGLLVARAYRKLMGVGI